MSCQLETTKLWGDWPNLQASIFYAPTGVFEVTYDSNVIRMHVGLVSRRSWHKTGDSENRLFVPGDLDVIPPGYRLREEYHRPATLLTLQLSSALIETVSQTLEIPFAQATEPVMWVRDPKLKHLCLAVKAQLKSHESTGRAFGEAIAVALAIRLITGYGTSGADVRPREELRRIFDYIDKHLDSDLSLTQLAEEGCTTVDGVKRLFREAVGVSAHRYIVERRVAYARSLLRYTQSPLKEVALRAGFYDQSHMTKWMQRVAGISPKQIKAIREKEA